MASYSERLAITMEDDRSTRNPVLLMHSIRMKELGVHRGGLLMVVHMKLVGVL